jgi:hypothetical protein
MMQQTRKIDLRLKEIERLQRELDAETVMLSKFRDSLQLSEHLVREADVFSARTVAKFELLARIADHLSKPDQYLYGGATTRNLYNHVSANLEEERRRIAFSRIDPDRRERNLPPEAVTPMANEVEQPNYNTFRSHLARFKDEGRLFYNPKTRCWRLTKLEVESAKAYGDEDDDRDRYAD